MLSILASCLNYLWVGHRLGCTVIDPFPLTLVSACHLRNCPGLGTDVRFFYRTCIFQPRGVRWIIPFSDVHFFSQFTRPKGGSVAEWLACWTQALSGNSLRQTVYTHCASVHQAAKLVATLLRVAEVTAGLAESNGSLPPGLWLTSPAGWLPRTRISSGTVRSVIEYGLPFRPTCVQFSLLNRISSTRLKIHWLF